MKFRDLDIGDHFIHWDTIDGCYYMYYKLMDDSGPFLDNELREQFMVKFGGSDTVYKVIV